MALDLGELAGKITLDDRGWTRPMQQAERGIMRLESTSRGSLNRMENEFGETGRGAARELGRGMGHAADEAGRAGQDAGERFVRGTETEVRRRRGVFHRSGRDAGESAGEGLGDGVESGGQGRLKGVGGKLAGIMGKAGPWLAAGAVVGGVFMQGLAGAMEKQDALAKLKAQVGDFGPSSAVLGKAAGALFAKGYGESMGDVTEGIRAVVQNLDGMKNASASTLTQMGARAMDVADIMDEDVGAVTRAVSQLLRTGLAKNAREAFDLIAAGSQQGANASEDLLDTVTEYSTQFRAVGISGPKAMGLLAQAVRGGARDLDTAADAIKEFAINSKSGSKAAADAFKGLGFNSDEMFKTFAAGGPKADRAFKAVVDRLRTMKDPMKRNAIVTALFGTKAEDLQDALFAFDPTTAVQSLGKVGGAADKAGKTLHETASARLTAFQRTVKGKLVDFVGGKILPGLTSFGAKVGPVFGKAVAEIKKWLDENGDKLDQWAAKIQQIAAIVGQIFSAGLTVAGKLWSIFGDSILSTLSNIIDTVLGYLTGVFTMILGVWNIFAGIFTGDWGRVWKGVKQIFSGAMKATLAILKGALRAVGIAFKIAGKLIHKAASWAADKVRSAFGRMKDAAVSKAQSLAAWMRGLPGRLRRALGNLGSLLWGAGRRVISGLINGIKSKIGDLGGAMGSIAGKIRGYLPFSPAKEGPLSGSGNPQASGAKIGTMLAAGITSSRTRVAAAMAGVTGTVTAAQETAFTVRRPRGRTGRGGGAAQPVRVILDVRGGPREFKQMIRNWVRVDGRGDVQLAFGNGRRGGN